MEKPVVLLELCTFIIVMVCLHVIINLLRCPAFKSTGVLCGHRPFIPDLMGQNAFMTECQINICHLPESDKSLESMPYDCRSPPIHSRLIDFLYKFLENGFDKVDLCRFKARSPDGCGK